MYTSESTGISFSSNTSIPSSRNTLRAANGRPSLSVQYSSSCKGNDTFYQQSLSSTSSSSIIHHHHHVHFLLYFYIIISSTFVIIIFIIIYTIITINSFNYSVCISKYRSCQLLVKTSLYWFVRITGCCYFRELLLKRCSAKHKIQISLYIFFFPKCLIIKIFKKVLNTKLIN